MINKEVTDLTELLTPEAEDLIPIIHDPSGTPVNRKITLANLQNKLSYAYIIIKSGLNYIAYNDIGVAVSTSTDFAVPLQYAIDALGDTGGKIVIKGGSTYTFTVAHYAVGDTVAQTMKIGVDLNYDNLHLVIEKGATITQAASLQLQVFFAGNIAGTGNGEVIDNTTIECYGWIDGNYANQGYSASGTEFQACPIAMYSTNGYFPYLQAKNFGQYSALVLYYGPNNRIGYINAKDSYTALGGAGCLDLERNSHATVGVLNGNSLAGAVMTIQDGGDHINIGVINAKDCMYSLQLETASSLALTDIQVGEVNGDGYKTGIPYYKPQIRISVSASFGASQNIQIGKVNIKNSAVDGMYIGFSGDASGSVNRVHIDSVIIRNSVQVADQGGNGAMTIGLCDSVSIDNFIAYDDQVVKTQAWGIKFVTGVTNFLCSGGNVTGNTGAITGFTTSMGKIKNLIGFVTENSGTGTIASGATSAIITHGLAVTPTLDNISIVGGENPTTDIGTIWVDTIGATYFTVNCEVAPSTSNFDFGWRAQIL